MIMEDLKSVLKIANQQADEIMLFEPEYHERLKMEHRPEMKKTSMTKEQKLVYDAMETIGLYIRKVGDDGKNVFIDVVSDEYSYGFYILKVDGSLEPNRLEDL